MWREGGSLNPENRVQLPDGTLIGRIDAGDPNLDAGRSTTERQARPCRNRQCTIV
jgi:hypothetical protein